MTKILVTGCAGFIGSHLCERLLADGNRVVGIDNFDPFYPRRVKEKNMVGLKGKPDFTFQEADIRDSQSFAPFIGDDVNTVVHLAGKAGVRPSIDNPQIYIDNNISGTLNVLNMMRDRGIRNLVFGSSSSIYGDRNTPPYRESAVVDMPISPYAQTKRSCELLNHTYHHLYGINVVNLRFFTVFGPRQRPDLAIHKFVRLISEGKAIPMFGDGSTQRDYTYVDDIVQGIMASIALVADSDRLVETINLGNNRPVSLNELIITIGSVMGTTPLLDRQPRQPGDVEMTCASIDKARELLDYHPSTTLVEGIRKFWEWYSKSDH